MSRYELVIKNESKKKTTASVGGAGGVNGVNNGAQTNSAGGETSNGAPGTDDASQVMEKLFGAAVLKNMASQVIGHEVGMVQLRTGSQHAQQRANFNYSIAQQGFNLVAGLAAGFAVGNVAGAAVGALSSLLNSTMSWALKAETMSLEKQLDMRERDMQAQRATVSGSRYQNVMQE